MARTTAKDVVRQYLDGLPTGAGIHLEQIWERADGKFSRPDLAQALQQIMAEGGPVRRVMHGGWFKGDR